MTAPLTRNDYPPCSQCGRRYGNTPEAIGKHFGPNHRRRPIPLSEPVLSEDRERSRAPEGKSTAGTAAGR